MDLSTVSLRLIRGVVPVPDITDLPPGRMIDLPGRGRTFVTDIPGPAGAPTLILLHAVACTAYLTWFPSLRALTSRYRVVLFDQRLHGRGIRCDAFRLEDCADDVIAVADALGLSTFVVAGYSMGGLVSQLTARRHPDRLSGMVLCSTTYKFQGTRSEVAFHRTFATLATALHHYTHGRIEQFAVRLADEPRGLTGGTDRWAFGEFRSTSAWAVAEAVADIGNFDSSGWLGELWKPTAVVITTRDHALPVERQRRLAELIPGATVHEVPAGHASCVLRAEKFVPALLDACESVDRRIGR